MSRTESKSIPILLFGVLITFLLGIFVMITIPLWVPIYIGNIYGLKMTKFLADVRKDSGH